MKWSLWVMLITRFKKMTRNEWKIFYRLACSHFQKKKTFQFSHFHYKLVSVIHMYRDFIILLDISSCILLLFCCKTDQELFLQFQGKFLFNDYTNLCVSSTRVRAVSLIFQNMNKSNVRESWKFLKSTLTFAK